MRASLSVELEPSLELTRSTQSGGDCLKFVALLEEDLLLEFQMEWKPFNLVGTALERKAE